MIIATTILFALLALAAYQLATQVVQDDFIYGVSHTVWPLEYNYEQTDFGTGFFHDDPVVGINEHILNYDHTDDLVIL